MSLSANRRPPRIKSGAGLRRRGRKRLAELDARARHKLRIGIKNLRYATEFFQALFAGRKARKRLRGFERQLKALQDCLGALNDIAVHQKLASDLVGEKGRRRERAFAIGLVSGREQSRIDPLRKAAVKAADRFVQARPFWV
jgi:triphosphatase